MQIFHVILFFKFILFGFIFFGFLFIKSPALFYRILNATVQQPHCSSSNFITFSSSLPLSLCCGASALLQSENNPFEHLFLTAS